MFNKRVGSLILKICFVISCIFIATPVVYAETISGTDKGFTCEITDGEACVTGMTSAVGKTVVIPSTLCGYPVTGIGAGAFYDCRDLTDITIPDGVEYIGGFAFYNTSLENVTLPNGVTSIGGGAFWCCDDLRTIFIPDSVQYIGSAAFEKCDELIGITIPSSVEQIGVGILEGCYVKYVSIPFLGFEKDEAEAAKLSYLFSTVGNDDMIPGSLERVELTNAEYIADYAFAGCQYIQEISLSEGVKSIGESAFAGCWALEELILPQSVETIEGEAFGGCDFKIFNIPSGIKSIEKDAFYLCDILNGFYYCGTEAQWNNLKIGSGNENLTAAERKNHMWGEWERDEEGEHRHCVFCNTQSAPISYTDYSLQYRCRAKIYTVSREEVSSPWVLYDTKSGVEHTGMRTTHADANDREEMSAMYSACVHETELVNKYCYRPYGGPIQEDTCWYGTEEEFKTEINDSDHWISDGRKHYRYTYCTSINHYIDYYYYMWSDWTDWGDIIYTPDDDTEVETRKLYTITYDANGGIGAPAYQINFFGEDCTLSSSVPTNGNLIFLGWATTPDGRVEYQPGDTYTQNTPATLYAIWNTVASITIKTLPNKTEYELGEELDTTGLTLVATHIDGSTEEISEGFAVSGFDSTYAGTQTVHVRYNFRSTNFKVFVNGKDNLTWTLDDNGTLTISGTGDMTNWGSEDSPWYEYCSAIKKVVIGDGITSIGSCAFMDCDNLTSVEIPNSVKTIYHHAFYDCTKLKSLTIPDGVTSIDYSAFIGCESLESITIPDSVESIGISAFAHCWKLADVYYGGTEDEWNAIVIDDRNELLTNATIHFTKKYQITYNANGGTGAPASQTKAYGKDLTLSDVEPVREGYVFQGWGKVIRGDVLYRAGDTYSVNSNIVLYAQWIPEKYTITYDANGGSNTPAAQTKYYGVEIILSDFIPTRELYKFVGWSTTTDGEVEYLPNSRYSMEGNRTLYAVWTTADTYQIDYDANGGSGAPLSQVKTENLALKLSETIPVRVGYAFNHWATEVAIAVDGVEGSYDCADDVGKTWTISCPDASSISLTFSSDTTMAYDAVYLQLYDCNGKCAGEYTGTKLAGKTVVVQGESVTIKMWDCGYSWQFDVTSAVAKIEYAPGDICTRDADVTLYASWAECSHQWDEGTTTVQPTHTVAGEASYICTVCGDSKTEQVAKLPEHSYGSWVESDALQHSKICGCGDIVYADHSWDNGVVTTEPTHTAFGVKTHTCIDCGATRTENVAKLSEHTYGKWQNTNYGYHQKTCACGDIITENHTRDGGVVTKKPTHTTTGVMTYTCVVCGDQARMTIAKQPHVFGDWIGINETQHTRSCTCGTVETEAHSYSAWKTQTAATCTEDGVEYRDCSECGAQEVRTIIASGHHYVSVVTDPSCTEQGYTTHTCSCGDTYTDTYTNALGHRVLWSGTELVESYTTNNDSNYPFKIDGDWYKSANKKNKTTSIFTIRALYKCTMVLKYKVSCEEEWDYLEISVNGNEKDRISGVVSGKEITLTLKAGDLLTITYHKDARESANDDTGYFMIVSCTKTEVEASKYIPAEEVEPTCTDAVVCDVCGQTIFEATGHKYDHDCDKDCNICGITRVTAHSYGAWVTENDNSHKRSCTCGHTETAAHNWGDGIVTIQPTQTTYGERKYTCEVCLATKTEPIYSYVVAYNANGGKNAPVSQCKIRGIDLVLSDVRPVREGYIFRCWTTNVTGEEPKTLAVSGLESDHNYSNDTNKEWVVSSPGAKSIQLTFDSRTAFEPYFDFLYIYDSSGKQITKYSGMELAGETIEVQGDLAKLVLTSDYMATRWGFAVTSAVAYYDTYNPGDSYSFDSDVMLYAVWTVCAHRWDVGVITAQSTHTTYGECTYTCEDCSATKTEQIAKTTAHSYGEWAKADAENHKRTCACGEVQSATHNWNNGTCLDCEFVCQHIDDDMEHTCDYCGEAVSTCVDVSPKDHKCDVCGEAMEVYEPGDANHDGKADSSDAVMILRKLVGYDVPGFYEDAADFNGDGKADSSDAVMILRKLVGYQ